MENEQKRPYYVLTRDEVKENMKKQIDEISQIFLISKSDATVLLMYYQWDSIQVSDCLVENKDKVLSASGLKSVVVDDPNREFSNIFCEICFKTCDDFYPDVGDHNLISTPFCSHIFCKTCWRKYLEKNFYFVEKKQMAISCPDRACRAAVGLDTIEKLSIHDQEMYDKYIMRSYLERNKVLEIKQCPARHCNYVIEFHQESNDVDDDEEDYSSNVVCLCGHIFCWRCMFESHKPVTCNNASDWLCRDLKTLLKVSDKSSSHSAIKTSTKTCPDSSIKTSTTTSPDSAIKTSTKTCPHCLAPVDLSGKQYFLFATCACRGLFCWKCMQSDEDHTTVSGLYKPCDVPKTLERRPEVEHSCVERWKASTVLMEEAKSEQQAFEKSIAKKPSDLNEKDVMIIRKGLMLIVQCRQVLKWSCVYDYFHAEYEISKREYLRFLQANATALVQSYSNTLKEEIERALSDTSVNFCCVKHKVSIETSNIGNYFYHFIKTLQDGLDDVKVKSYDDYGGLFWLCDRCTYGNTWFHKECQMCRDDIAAPPELSGLSLN